MFVVWLIVEVTEEASTTDLVQPSGFQWFFVDLLDNFTYVRLLARQASLLSAAGCAASLPFPLPVFENLRKDEKVNSV